MELNESFKMYCEGCCPSGPVWEHNLEYWKESQQWPEKVLFLKYDEMMAAPEKYTKKLAEFIGCPFTAEEEREKVVEEVVRLCSFEKLSGLKVNKNGSLSSGKYTFEKLDFFRNGKVGDWSNYLMPEMGKQLTASLRRNFRVLVSLSTNHDFVSGYWSHFPRSG
uniref:Sulfotransferase n=1 Tax=Ananas comosus var. bracteatus TaxID=296719 RepID=A0A6V7Q3H0_ANACO|nr:unnamed protein product [Ananas comosus var. bracteatus]